MKITWRIHTPSRIQNVMASVLNRCGQFPPHRPFLWINFVLSSVKIRNLTIDPAKETMEWKTLLVLLGIYVVSHSCSTRVAAEIWMIALAWMSTNRAQAISKVGANTSIVGIRYDIDSKWRQYRIISNHSDPKKSYWVIWMVPNKVFHSALLLYIPL